jgi:predicted DNA-binding transcriptional regulator AlpA
MRTAISDQQEQSLLPEIKRPTLTEGEAAAFLSCKRPTLTAWRRKQAGPPFYQIGRLIRYSQQDLVEYLGSRRRNYAA